MSVHLTIIQLCPTCLDRIYDRYEIANDSTYVINTESPTRCAVCRLSWLREKFPDIRGSGGSLPWWMKPDADQIARDTKARQVIAPGHQAPKNHATLDAKP